MFPGLMVKLDETEMQALAQGLSELIVLFTEGSHGVEKEKFSRSGHRSANGSSK